MKLTPYLLIALGGALGALSRYEVGVVVARRVGTAWPYGTFLINVTGCFLIGFFMTLATERFTFHEGWRYLFPVGFVGAYTTFSTYEYETVRLFEQGAPLKALGYVLASTLAGFASVMAAMWVARRF